MNKKWCAIGAGALTLIIMAGVIGALAGLTLLMFHFAIFRYAMHGTAGITFLIILAAAWKGLYEECKDYWAKKEAS